MSVSETMALVSAGEEDALNCTNLTRIPSTVEYLDSLGPAQWSYIIPALVAAGLTAMFIVWHAVLIWRGWQTVWGRNRDMVWALSVFPVVLTINVLGLLIPQMWQILTFYGDLYSAYMSWRLFRMVVGEFGGREQLVATYGDRVMNPCLPPCCCCWCCCREAPRVTVDLLKRRERYVLSLFFLQLVNTVILTFLYLLGYPYDTNVMGPGTRAFGITYLLTNPAFYKIVLTVAITLTNLYLIVQLIRMLFAECRQMRIMPKFIVVQFTCWMGTNQASIMNFFRSLASFDCRETVPTITVFSEKLTVIILFEVTVAILLARLAYANKFSLAAAKKMNRSGSEEAMAELTEPSSTDTDPDSAASKSLVIEEDRERLTPNGDTKC